MDGVKKDFNHEQSLGNHEGPPHIKAMCNYEGNMRDLLMHVKALHLIHLRSDSGCRAMSPGHHGSSKNLLRKNLLHEKV